MGTYMQDQKFRSISFWMAILFILLGGIIPQLAAHPHVFIDGLLAPKVSPDGQYLQGIEVRWIFDQLYSSQMIFDFDSNRNGEIDREEERQIYDQAFSHLKEQHYFLYIREQGRRKRNINLGTASNFHSTIENGQMIYQFYVPFAGDSTKGVTLTGGREYLIYLEDSEYFIAFDSLLNPGPNSIHANFSSKDFMVQNLQWGPYPVRAVTVKGL